MKKLTTILTLLAASASLALAQDTPPAPKPGEKPPGHEGPGGPGGRRDPEAGFKKLDANNDGSVSLDEFKASPMAQKDPAKAEERFKKMDTDNNGSLSLDEFKAGRRGPGGPGGGKHGDKKEEGAKKP